MSNVFNVGDRVVCIPFKHKGKVATVRFYGAIGRKFGTWVGLELDEPTGECSGDFNGEYLFECAENYGLVLRNTQVKLYDPNEVPTKPIAGGQAKLTLDENNFGGNDSPLISPMNAAAKEKQGQAGAEETKQGWRDKLEKLRVKKLEEKTKVVQPEDPSLDKIRSSFAPASGIRRNDDGTLEVSQNDVTSRSLLAEKLSSNKEEGAQSVPTKIGIKKPTLNMKDVEAGLPEENVKESAKDRLEKNRLAAIEKKKELQAKQDALAQQRNLRQAATATPRGSASTKIGFTAQPVTTPRTASNLRNQSNLKGATAKTGTTSVAKANAYQSTTGGEKPTEAPVDSKRPAMTQSTIDTGAKRQPSASRLAGTARDPKADTLTKKVPPGKVAPAATGKTPLKQSIASSDALNKSLAPKDLKGPPAVASSFTTAEIKKLEGQLQEKEDEIAKLQQEVETQKQKIGSMMIKHNGEVKRQQEEISLLKKQVETAGSQQTGSEESQAQIAATLALLEQSKEAERQAQERIAELEEQVSAIRNQLADAKKQAAQAQTTAAVKIEEYEQEIQRMHKEYQDQSQSTSAAANQQFQQELDQSKKDKKELADQIALKAKQLEEAAKLIEKLRQDIKEEQERREEEVEILKLEKDALADEKQDILNRYMESAKVEEEDPLKDIGIEEIKIQNKKLRQAITTLTFGFEEERKRLELKMSQETEKDRIIADQDARLKQMDLLLDELEQKDQEMADMREKFDEILEYEIMVEEMVQEIANKEGEVEEMTERMIEIEEEHAMLEELVENLETYNKELQDEVADKERDIVNLGQEKEQLETIVIDQDAITSKYKERQAQLSKQIAVLTEQLEITVSTAGNKDQVSILLEKQQVLISKLRDAAKRSLEITKERITANQLKMRAEVVQQMLPESLAEEALLPSLEKIQMLNVTKHKATLLIRQICENFLDNAKNVYEDPDQLQVYIQTLLKICLMSHRVIECASIVQFQVANMTPGQYDEITKLLVWLQVKVTSNELDSVLEQLLDEALGQNFEASSLEQAIQQMENLQSRTEKMFITISPEELKQQELSGKQELNPSIEQQKRQNLAKVCPKLNYRTAALKVALSVVFVPHLQEKFESPEERHQMQVKVALIYQRLMQSILKIDLIDNRQPGEEFFQDSLNSDLRLQQKYETFKMLWDGTPAQKSDAKKKSWISVVEAVERDITQLTNDYKFKKLTQMVDERYGDRKLDLNDLYAVDFEASGPWRTVAQSIKTDLQDMGALKQKNTSLLEQSKQAAFQVLQLKREKEENAKIVTTLETKLGQALAKAEQLNALEIERDEQNQKIQNLQKKLDSEVKDNASSKAALEETKKKLEEAKKSLAEKAAAPAQEQTSQQQRVGASRRGNTIKGGPKDFFTGLQNSSFRDMREQMTPARSGSVSGGNTAQIIQSAQASEDMYINIINDLQADRMRLRGKDMTARLNNLQTPESAFAQLIRQTKETKNSQTSTVKLNSEEQVKIEVALNSVETLKTKFKRQMATARIVDFTKLKEASGTTSAPISPLEVEKAVAEHQKRNSEQFNFLVLEARNKMNDALEFLFQKDSKLRNLQTQTTETALSSHKAIEESASKVGEIKIGQLKLRGKIPLPQRRVVLDEAALTELRRNVQLLTI